MVYEIQQSDLTTSTSSTSIRSTMAIARLDVPSVNVDFVLKDKIYNALKQAIVSMNVDTHIEEPRLDKRQLAQDLRGESYPYPRSDSSP